MARTREYREVFNNSDEVYKEEFKGQMIVIPPRSSIIMERREAVHFTAQYAPFDREKSSGVKPLSWRPARGKVPAAKEPEVDIEEPKFVNQATGVKFDSKEELDEDLKGFAHLTLKKEE